MTKGIWIYFSEIVANTRVLTQMHSSDNDRHESVTWPGLSDLLACFLFGESVKFDALKLSGQSLLLLILLVVHTSLSLRLHAVYMHRRKRSGWLPAGSRYRSGRIRSELADRVHSKKVTSGPVNLCIILLIFKIWKIKNMDVLRIFTTAQLNVQKTNLAQGVASPMFLFQILSKSVKGFPSCKRPKMGVFHWQTSTVALTTGQHYGDYTHSNTNCWSVTR